MAAPVAVVKTRAETAQAERRIRALRKRFQDLGTSVAVVQGPLGGISGRLTAISAGLSRVGVPMLGVGLGIAAVTAGFAKMIRVSMQAERQQGRIAALLRTTGMAAGLTGEELEEMARRVGKETLTSAAEVRDAQAALLTFRTITGDIFEDVIELGQDAAESMGTNLKSAVISLGKALEDPARGLSQLRRQGLSLTESQIELIKNLHESGNILAAQIMAIDALKASMGGAGAGAAGGLAGAFDSLSESITNLLNVRSGPGTILGNLGRSINFIAQALENYEASLNPTLEMQRVDLLDERVRLTQRLQELQSGGQDFGFGEAELFSKEAADVQARLEQVNQKHRELNDLIMQRKAESEERKRQAALAAQERAQEEAIIKKEEEFNKALEKTRKSVGSKTFEMQEQREKLALLTQGYLRGKIGVDEYRESVEKLIDSPITEAGAQGLQAGLLTPAELAAIQAGRRGTSSQEGNKEEKRQTVFLKSIAESVKNLSLDPVAV